MQELNMVEVDAVGGAGFFEFLGNPFGWFCGKGAEMRIAIDKQNNELLSGLQYGA